MSSNKTGRSNYKHAKLVLASAGVLLIGALLFSVFTLPTSKTSGNQGETTPTQGLSKDNTPTPVPATPTPTSTPTPTPTSTPTPTPVEPFVRTEDEEIIEVIEGYCNAKLSGDLEAFEPYVNNLETININYYIKQYSLAKSTSNFEIYTISGKYGLAYIAFVVYDLEITAIDTPSLEATLLQLVESEPDEEGKTHLLVNTEVLTDEQRNYQNEIQTHEDFIALYLDFWQRDFEKVQTNESYAKVWYNLFVSGIDGFETTYPTVEDFISYISTDATLEDFLALKQALSSLYEESDPAENIDDPNSSESGESTSGSGESTSGSGDTTSESGSSTVE